MKEMQIKAKEARDARKELGLKSTKSPREKHDDQPLSLRRAITAKCYECMGDGSETGWTQLIKNCCSVTCPLHTVRPYQ